MSKRAVITVKGIVQGVFYRSETKRKAEQLQLTGVVRNLHDGAVEILVEGKGDKIDQLVQWCWTGSPESDVEDVIVEYHPYKGEFINFQISS